MRTRRAGFTLWLVAGLCAASSAALGFGPAEEGYRRLKVADIRKTFIGKTFTDEAHLSERFKTDGTIEGFVLGTKIARTWRIIEDELCITTHSEETCYAAWRKGSEVQLVFGNSDNPIYGKIK
jgi:hypothetical protein